MRLFNFGLLIMKMILVSILALGALGCSPSESQLREKSFRAAANDYLNSIPDKIASCKRMEQSQWCEKMARELKSSCSDVPDIRYDANLKFVHDHMKLIHENLSLIAGNYDFISRVGPAQDAKKQEWRERIATGYSDIEYSTNVALKRLRK
jgi:hypothetical protein